MHARMVLVGSIVALSVGSVGSAYAVENKRAGVLLPDMSFIAACEGQNDTLISNKISEFLQLNEFRVLDMVRLAREQKVAYAYAFNVVSLDERHRTVKMVAFSFAPHDYHVVLSSPPPTVHDTDLESRLTTFVAKDLGCDVRQISRNENTETAVSIYQETYEQAVAWFKEADRMAHAKP